MLRLKRFLDNIRVKTRRCLRGLQPKRTRLIGAANAAHHNDARRLVDSTDGTKTSQLPVELYREIFEYLNRDDFIALVVVCRAFQAEAERRLYRIIMIDCNYVGTPRRRDVVKYCAGLVALPRIWPLVRMMYIRRISNGPVESHVVSSVADLLGKFTNLTMLHIHDPTHVWRFCGDLFRSCSFQLRIFSCHFFLDRDLASFLDSQPSLWRFSWAPPDTKDYPDEASRLCVLPPSALPNLAVCSFTGAETRKHDISSGRPIVHFASISQGHRGADLVHNLTRGSKPLKSLYMNPFDGDLLCLLPSAFPFLGYLGFVNLDRSEIVSDALLRTRYIPYVLSSTIRSFCRCFL
jgi:hypothetical protein